MEERKFSLIILGRTIEHLGTQMYKHRAPSIAELIANCWDAGATEVWVTLPPIDTYDCATSVISIMDNGEGMTPDSIQNRYLVVGRNRRSEDGGMSHARRVMGRKGIGKLAGFGLANKITITTWTKDSEKAVSFSMSLSELKTEAGRHQTINFPWSELEKGADWPTSGTRIELSRLRHVTPIDRQVLVDTLARRFSRTTRGAMILKINNTPLSEPTIDSMHEFPTTGELAEATLPSGKVVKYRYKFARKPIRSKELQGFVVYANERTAQAPPFFFNVESTASAQYSTRYLSGEITADYLDSGTDDESDPISTDRQELDWEKAELSELKEWGDKLTRRLLIECGEKLGGQLENWVLADADFSVRLNLLDPASRQGISSFLKVLGQKSPPDDPRTRELADSLIRAYEFRTFHDVIDELQEASIDPEQLEAILGHLHDWKVLESRAILEIVRGRISIIDKLERMIINDAPETASARTHDNLHDLLAEYPWIFNPDWQVFVEERTLSKQLSEWGQRDCPDDMAKKRVDFLALTRSTDELIIIELKRPGHAFEWPEYVRLQSYQVELMRARPKARCVLVYGGVRNIQDEKWEVIKAAKDFESLEWSAMFGRAKGFYQHYEAILRGDSTDLSFRSKEVEVAKTREVLRLDSSHRDEEDRARGLGESRR